MKPITSKFLFPARVGFPQSLQQTFRTQAAKNAQPVTHFIFFAGKDQFTYAALTHDEDPDLYLSRSQLIKKLDAYRTLYHVAILQLSAITAEEKRQKNNREKGGFLGGTIGFSIGPTAGLIGGSLASAAVTSGPFWAVHPVLGAVVTVGLATGGGLTGLLAGIGGGAVAGEWVSEKMDALNHSPTEMSPEDLKALTRMFNSVVDAALKAQLPTPQEVKNSIGKNRKRAEDKAEHYAGWVELLQKCLEREDENTRVAQEIQDTLTNNPRNADWLTEKQAQLFREGGGSRFWITQNQIEALRAKLTGLPGAFSKIDPRKNKDNLPLSGFQARVEEFVGKSTPFKTRVAAFRDVPILMKELEIKFDEVPEVSKLERSLLLALTDGSEANFPTELLGQRRVLQVKALRHWLERQEETTEEFQNIITAALRSNHKALQKEAYLGYRQHPFSLPLLTDPAWQQDMQPYLEKWDSFVPKKTYSLLPDYD